MKKIILYGCGATGYDALNKLGVDNVAYYCDSNKEMVGEIINGKRVISLDELAKIYLDYIVVISTTSKYIFEIAEILDELAISYIMYPVIVKEIRSGISLSECMEKYSDPKKCISAHLEYCRYRSERIKFQYDYLKEHTNVTV